MYPEGMGAAMKFKDMLGTINLFQVDTHGIDHSQLNDAERMHFMRQYSLALIVEQAELLQTLPWKPWKYNNQSSFDKSEALREWCDCLIFLLDQALALDFEAEKIEETFIDIIKTKSRIQKTK